jgi:uncharacterized protein YndB with AHSA1/START domain/DNA-binding transcriptional ArsR family regulator
MDPQVFAALGEPNRLRIVELLEAAPRSVGEIAAALGLRQPQTTKHLQTLERAGLVTMHPLGQRRIYALRRAPFDDLKSWSDALATTHPSEPVLDQYAAAVATELSLAAADPEWAVGRTLQFKRVLGARIASVWAHWTTADLVQRWWSPEHFEVVEADVQPVSDGPLEIVMAEGDGTRHRARGRFLAVSPPRHLRFELGPLTPDGTPLMSAVHDLRLSERAATTHLALSIRIVSADPAAAPALAGMQPGWEQLLTKLERALSERRKRET